MKQDAAVTRSRWALAIIVLSLTIVQFQTNARATSRTARQAARGATESMGEGGTVVYLPLVAQTQQPTSPNQVVPHRFIVKLREPSDYDGTVADLADAVISGQPVRVITRYEHVLRGFALDITGADEPTVLTALRTHPAVEYVEPAYYLATSPNANVQLPTHSPEFVTPSPDEAEVSRSGAVSQDQALAVDWGLDRIDQRSATLDGAYTAYKTGDGVKVFISSSGILPSHTEYAGRVLEGFNATNDPQGMKDCLGTGTALAGLVAGQSVGVARNARVVPIKVFPCDNAMANTASSDQFLSALNWLAAQKGLEPHVPYVLLIAHGLLHNTTVEYSSVSEAIKKLINQLGVVVIVSAIQGSPTSCSGQPVSFGGVTVVAAIDKGDVWIPNQTYESCVDLLAPGGNVRSAASSGDLAYRTYVPRDAYAPARAAAFTAGVAALYLEGVPTATSNDVQTALVNGATQATISGLLADTTNRLLYSLIGPNQPSGPPPPPPPSAFTKRQPANGASIGSSSATASWTALSGATEYQICIMIGSQRCLTDPTAGEVGWAPLGNATSLQLSGLRNNTTYSYQVRARLGNQWILADSGNWFSFTTTDTSANSFRKLTPGNAAANQPTGMALTWSPLSGAQYYLYCVTASPGITCPGEWQRVDSTAAYVPALRPLTRYYWQVRGVTSAGTIPADGSSQWFVFQTGAESTGEFHKRYPSNGQLGLSSEFTFEWSAHPNATDYEFCITRSFASNGYPGCLADDAGFARLGNTTQYQVTGLEPNTRYYIQVRAYLSDGRRVPANGVGQWFMFETGSFATGFFGKLAPAPFQSGVSRSPSLTWSPYVGPTGAIGYDYCVSTTLLTCVSGWTRTTSTTAVISALQPNQRYFWQVRAVLGDGSFIPANGSSQWASFVTGL